MKQMTKPIVLGLIVILIVGILAWQQSKGSSTVAPASNTQNQGQQAAQNSNTPYSLADVSKHAVESSCWTAINGEVYDLTDWVNKHPGGRQAILSICGKDGSAAFNAQHGGAQLQQQILAGYKVGNLAK